MKAKSNRKKNRCFGERWANLKKYNEIDGIIRDAILPWAGFRTYTNVLHFNPRKKDLKGPL
jgi:hypothetical protein